VAIITVPVDIDTGVSAETLSQLAEEIGFKDSSKAQAADIIQKLYNLFIKTDCSLLEINPLAEDIDGNMHCNINAEHSKDIKQEGELGFRLAPIGHDSSLLASIRNTIPNTERALFAQFVGFMQKFQKRYADETEVLKRFDLFRENVQAAAECQRRERGTAYYGVTPLSDLSRDELKRITGYDGPLQRKIERAGETMKLSE